MKYAFKEDKIKRSHYGLLAQLVRAPVVHAGGHEFESHTVRFQGLNDKPKVVKPKTCMDGPKSRLLLSIKD